ncbi:hypothetical protein [Streptosporangium vulgare]
MGRIQPLAGTGLSREPASRRGRSGTRWVLVVAGDNGYRRRSALLAEHSSGGMFLMYKEFAIEAIVWLIPVVILVGLAYMITRPA